MPTIGALQRLSIHAFARRVNVFVAKRGGHIGIGREPRNQLQLIQHPAHQRGDRLAFGAQSLQHTDGARRVAFECRFDEFEHVIARAVGDEFFERFGTNEQEGAAFVGPGEMGSDPNRSVFQPLFRANAPLANAYYQTLLKTDSPYAALVRTLTQYMYQLHSYRFAGALAGAGTPVYMYQYRYQNGRAFGARHGDELHYIWGAAHILSSNDDAAKKQLAGSLHGAWAAFIKNGDPKWPAYKNTDRQVMVFNDVDSVVRLSEVYDDKQFPSAVFVIK